MTNRNYNVTSDNSKLQNCGWSISNVNTPGEGSDIILLKLSSVLSLIAFIKEGTKKVEGCIAYNSLFKGCTNITKNIRQLVHGSNSSASILCKTNDIHSGEKSSKYMNVKMSSISFDYYTFKRWPPPNFHPIHKFVCTEHAPSYGGKDIINFPTIKIGRTNENILFLRT